MQLNLGPKKRKPQLRHNVTYRDNEKEKELYSWIEENGEVGGVSNFIKKKMYEIMISEKQGK